jgi:hypothetical protein
MGCDVIDSDIVRTPRLPGQLKCVLRLLCLYLYSRSIIAVPLSWYDGEVQYQSYEQHLPWYTFL